MKEDYRIFIMSHKKNKISKFRLKKKLLFKEYRIVSIIKKF